MNRVNSRAAATEPGGEVVERDFWKACLVQLQILLNGRGCAAIICICIGFNEIFIYL